MVRACHLDARRCWQKLGCAHPRTRWFAQIYYRDDAILAALPNLHAAGVRIVVDHCGGFDPEKGLAQARFQALLEPGRSGRAAAKLAGAFRRSKMPRRWFGFAAPAAG